MTFTDYSDVAAITPKHSVVDYTENLQHHFNLFKYNFVSKLTFHVKIARYASVYVSYTQHLCLDVPESEPSIVMQRSPL